MLLIRFSNIEIFVHVTDSNAAIVGYDAHESLSDIPDFIVVM